MTDTHTEPELGTIDVVFDGPPSHESGRFVEVEDAAGRSISVGEWIDRGDGFWALRIPDPRRPTADDVRAKMEREKSCPHGGYVWCHACEAQHKDRMLGNALRNVELAGGAS